MGIVVIVLVAVYAALALFASAAAARMRAAEPVDPADLPNAVAIVAARNEEEALPGCLEALIGQHYPPGRLRIIVADDGSEDRTREIVERYSPRVEYLRVPEGFGLIGKAAAIHAAVSGAREDVILLTDADCRPPAHWAQTMAAQLFDRRTGLVSGLTSIDISAAAHETSASKPLLVRVQALDWTLLLTFAAGLSGAGVPLTAMGNNMAFRRRAYEDVGGYPALPASVTEDHILFRAVLRTGWQARLLLDKRLENVTLPLPTLRAVFAQRKRWVTGGLRADAWVYLIYSLVWTIHVAIVAACVIAPILGFAALVVKLVADAVVLRTGTGQLERPNDWILFPAFETYMFGYVVALPFFLLASPHINWRGRRY